jgi:hypothetical protein
MKIAVLGLSMSRISRNGYGVDSMSVLVVVFVKVATEE